MNRTITHLEYVDKIKALACVLVVLGHFIMSMDASNILPFNAFTEWFKETIYTFHVQLFFLCSGFGAIRHAGAAHRRKGFGNF